MYTSKMIWTDKYKPKLLTDFAYVQNKHFNALKWLKNWNKNSKFLILTGPTGIGKTCFVHTLARICNYKIIENHEDRSVEEALNIILQSKTKTFENKKKLILIDNVDGFSDYKFYAKLFSFKAQKTSITSPIIFCCNNIYNCSLVKFKDSCEVVGLNVNINDVIDRLNVVVKNENIRIDPKALVLLAEKNNLDIRSCINNLQILNLKNKDYINTKNIQDYKTNNQNVFKTCKDIFESNLRTKNCYNNISNMYKQHENKLFELCFDNYPLLCRMFMYFKDICRVNNLYNKLQDNYKFMFIDIYNQRCRSIKKVELRNEIVRHYKNEHMKYFLYNNNIYRYDTAYFVLVLPCFKHLLINNINNKDVEFIKQMQLAFPIHENFIDKCDAKIKAFNDYVMEQKTNNIKIVNNTMFQYRYKESASSCGRLHVSIYNLFK